MKKKNKAKFFGTDEKKMQEIVGYCDEFAEDFGVFLFGEATRQVQEESPRSTSTSWKRRIAKSTEGIEYH
jgi:hypothetical protein